jgi:F-type H+-transporting ATPase subunit b
MRKLIPLLIGLVLAAAPTLAGAVLASPGAPEAGHGAGTAGGPFSGDLGNALWTLVVFALLLVVLGKYAWTPILGGLKSREQFIRDSLEEAKRNRDQSEARLKEYEGKLAQARDEVEALLAEARRDAAALRQREEARAREEAEKTLERARREIQIATETAVQELYRQATDLSVEAASRILKREVSAADHERLIADTIAALEPEKPN